MEQLASRFARAMLTRLQQQSPEVEVLPTLVSQAWVEVLPVSGAGISLVGEMRVPVGFSDDRAQYVEQLQITFGDGPCLESMRHRRPLALEVDQLEQRWPEFTANLTNRTDYRSVVSLPIPLLGTDPVAALDLYSTSTTVAPDLTDPDTATAVQRLTAAYLFAPEPPAVAATAPLATSGSAAAGEGLAGWARWLSVVATHPRLQVWQVVGQVIAHSHLDSADALALIRGYAYSHDLTLDQLIRLVEDGQLDVTAITNTPPRDTSAG